MAGDLIDRTPTVSAADPSACRKNDLRAYISDRGGGEGGFLGIIGVGVPPGSANPDPISDQKMSFSHPFSDLASKKLHLIITWIRTGKKILNKGNAASG